MGYKLMWKWSAICLVVLLAGCAGSGSKKMYDGLSREREPVTKSELMKMTTDQRKYYERAMAQPTEFEISEEMVDVVRMRAQQWITKYSSMGVNTVTDYLISTAEPLAYSTGYRVLFTPKEDRSQVVNVGCMWGNRASKKDAMHNSHLLADYLLTKEVYPDLIKDDPEKHYRRDANSYAILSLLSIVVSLAIWYL